MKKEGKNFSTCVNRISLIGDCITSIAVLKYMRKLYPNCYNTFSIAKKCSQAIPLFIQNPYIDKIHVNEFLENPKKKEFNFLKSHDIWAPPDIKHPKQNWQNFYSIYQENFEMLGVDSSKIENKDLEVGLVKWFDVIKFPKTIAIWPMAGNGLDLKRSPNLLWYEKLVVAIVERTEYSVFIFGHPKDFYISGDNYKYNRVTNFNNLGFFEQIKMTLGTNLCLNTDSGSGLVLGAYGHPQITLLTNWNVGHIQNFTSLAPFNKNNINIFKENDINFIDHEEVFKAIKEID